MDREDGEMSDDNIDNAMVVDDDPREETKQTQVDGTLLYKPENNGLVVEVLEKVDAEKLDERARRFGLNLTGKRVITQNQIDELYENCGIRSGNERHFRFDSIHLNGVDGLSTREIFQYLEDFKPLSLEWIDNSSCNVVCQDHISAALALLAHSREIKNDHLKTALADKTNHHWREGVPHPRKDLILMRFATNGDKKLGKKKPEKIIEKEHIDDDDSTSKNPWGDLCKSWGVYDHQEVFHSRLPKEEEDDYDDEIDERDKIIPIKNKRLSMRLGKRLHTSKNSDNSDDSGSDSEWQKRSKVPRMRMHADDEEQKQRQKQTSKLPKVECKEEFAPLSIEVVNTKSRYTQRDTTKLSDKFRSHGTDWKPSIQSRLGGKVTTEADYSDDEQSSDSLDDVNIMSKVQKVNHAKTSSSVWSRLETTTTDDQQDLRKIIKSKNKTDDLRNKIGKSKKAILRIEIDNS